MPVRPERVEGFNQRFPSVHALADSRLNAINVAYYGVSRVGLVLYVSLAAAIVVTPQRRLIFQEEYSVH